MADHEANAVAALPEWLRRLAQLPADTDPRRVSMAGPERPAPPPERPAAATAPQLGRAPCEQAQFCGAQFCLAQFCGRGGATADAARLPLQMASTLGSVALALLNSDTQDAQRNAAALAALRSAEARAGDGMTSYNLGFVLFEGKAGVPCDKGAAAACLMRAVRLLESSPDSVSAETRGKVRAPAASAPLPAPMSAASPGSVGELRGALWLSTLGGYGFRLRICAGPD